MLKASRFVAYESFHLEQLMQDKILWLELRANAKKTRAVTCFGFYVAWKDGV
jgi:hypothetical protein